MKKITKLLIPFITLFSLISCNNINKKAFIMQKDNIDTFVYVNELELDSLLYQKQDFILVLGQNGCSTCDIIKPNLIRLIKKKNYIIYWAEINEYLKLASKYNIDDKTYSATVQVYKNGQILKSLPYEKNLYYDEDQLEFTLSKYTTPSNIYLINDYIDYSYTNDYKMLRLDLSSFNDLKLIKEKDEKNTVLFSWYKCPDCISLKNDFLLKHMASQKKKIYLFEVDYLRSKVNENSEPDLSLFHEFANMFLFSSYKEGRVPSFITYQNNEKIDMAVYLNDVIENENDQYIVKESFYKDLIGKQGSNLVELKEELSKLELEYIKEYLIKNL